LRPLRLFNSHVFVLDSGLYKDHATELGSTAAVEVHQLVRHVSILLVTTLLRKIHKRLRRNLFGQGYGTHKKQSHWRVKEVGRVSNLELWLGSVSQWYSRGGTRGNAVLPNIFLGNAVPRCPGIIWGNAVNGINGGTVIQ